MQTGYFPCDSHSIYYEIHQEEFLSSNEPVVFLHEGLGSIDQWKSFPHRLMDSEKAAYLIYDRPGYGKSSPVKQREADYLHREADYLMELAKKLSIDTKLRIFGHSDGATLALLFAARYPQACESIVIEAPHVILEDITIRGVKMAIDEWENGSLRKRMKKYHGNNTDSMFSSWASFWSNPQHYSWNILEEMKSITCPVFFIQGERDHFGSFRQGSLIEESITGSYAELLLDDCGHIPHLEQQEIIVSEVQKFWQKSRFEKH